MSSTSGNKDIATEGSDHQVVAPPQVSLAGTPPAPAPAPFVTTGSTNDATGTKSATTIAGKKVVVKGSAVKTKNPGNKPATPNGGDVASHAIAGINGYHEVTGGSGNTFADKEPVARTTDSVGANGPSPAGGVHQQTGILQKGAGGGASSAKGKRKKRKKKGKKTTAGVAVKAKRKSAPKKGKASAAANEDTTADPVTVATGRVVDDVTEIALPGTIPLLWKRSYSSSRAEERTCFGRGGWVSNLEQWIDEGEDVWTLRDHDGRDIYFEKIKHGETTIHRQERLKLTLQNGVFTVTSLETRRRRVYTRLEAGGPRAVLRAIRDPYGNGIELQYESKRLVRVNDTAGRSLRVIWREAGIARVEVWSANAAAPALLVWVDYDYSNRGALAAAVDAMGARLAYDYDGRLRLKKRTLTTGVSFYYSYDDATGRCIRTVGEGGLFEADLDYDEVEGTTTTSGNQAPRRFTWTDEGLVLREETFDGNWARVRTYDEDHYLLSEANAAGEKTSFGYDARGNLTRRTDPAGNVTLWAIADDRPVRRVGPDGLETKYRFNAQGDLVELDPPSGLRATLHCDGLGRLATIVGPDGPMLTLGYDEQHNVIEERDARGAVTHFEYDALGRPTARLDALGRATRLRYDLLGRPLEVLRPDGTITRAEYDARGRVTRYVDALGQVSELEYAGVDALVRFVEPTGQEWRFKYDELERLRRITNPRAETYQFNYDDASRVEDETPFHGGKTRYFYSKAENLARIEYPDGTWRQLFHDPLGNLIADQSPHGNLAFERDKLGRLEQAIVKEDEWTYATKFQRDALGRVVAEHQGEGVLSITYDERGRRASRVLPNGATTKYFYDVAGACVGVDHDGYRVDLQRDLLGREVHRHLHQGRVDMRWAYDAMDRLVDQSVTTPTPAGGAHAELVRRRWAYDPNGRVTAIADARWGSTFYRYDSLGQLLQAARGRHNEVFEYDVTGSLVNVLDDVARVGHARPWFTRTGNMLVNSKEARYENDVRGRRTKKRLNDEYGEETDDVTEYFWDCRDRLREVRFVDGRRVVFSYDAFGRRIRKEEYPAERADVNAMVLLALEKGKEALPTIKKIEFWWDGDAIAGDVELGSAKGPRVFVHEPRTLVPMLQAEGGAVFACVNDHLGMPKELVDQDGRVAWAAAHSALGDGR